MEFCRSLGAELLRGPRRYPVVSSAPLFRRARARRDPCVGPGQGRCLATIGLRGPPSESRSPPRQGLQRWMRRPLDASETTIDFLPSGGRRLEITVPGSTRLRTLGRSSSDGAKRSRDSRRRRPSGGFRSVVPASFPIRPARPSSDECGFGEAPEGPASR